MIPDFVITGPTYRSHGPGGYQCTGFWDHRWDLRPELVSCSYCLWSAEGNLLKIPWFAEWLPSVQWRRQQMTVLLRIIFASDRTGSVTLELLTNISFNQHFFWPTFLLTISSAISGLLAVQWKSVSLSCTWHTWLGLRSAWCYVMLYGYLYSASHRRLFRGALSVTGRWKEKWPCFRNVSYCT